MACSTILTLLNTEMGEQGSLQTNCDLLFFTHIFAYKAIMCCNGLSLFVYDRINPDFGWRAVVSGTVPQVVQALQAAGPFLTTDEFSIFWSSIP